MAEEERENVLQNLILEGKMSEKDLGNETSIFEIAEQMEKALPPREQKRGIEEI